MYKRIKNLREDNDYTQEFVASYLKINRVVYNRYENGIREIPISLLIELAKLYNVSIDYIVGISNKKSGKKNNNQILFLFWKLSSNIHIFIKIYLL